MDAQKFLDLLPKRLIVRAVIDESVPFDTGISTKCYVPLGPDPRHDGFARVTCTNDESNGWQLWIAKYEGAAVIGKHAADEIQKWSGPWTSDEKVVCVSKANGGVSVIDEHNVMMLIQLARAHGMVVGHLRSGRGFNADDRMALVTTEERLDALVKVRMRALQEVTQMTWRR